MIKIGIYEAKTKLSQLIERSRNGEEVVISRGKKPMVRLVPIGPQASGRALGTAKGQVRIKKGFFDSLADFSDYEPS